MNPHLSNSLHVILAVLAASDVMSAQTIEIDPGKTGSQIPQSLYGVFFEEINHAGDGGIYAELVKNRNFEEHVIPSGTILKDGYVYAPHELNYEHGTYRDWKIKWDTDSLRMDGWTLTGDVTSEVTDRNPLHPNTPNALFLNIRKPGATLENSGYWGMRIIGKEKYDLRLYLDAADYSGRVTVSIIGEKGLVLAKTSFDVENGGGWKEYSAVMTPSKTDTRSRLKLEFGSSGEIYVDYVSLFPQNTFKGRKNGLRPDVAQMIADLKPGFIRWPGGCIVEGATLDNRAK